MQKCIASVFGLGRVPHGRQHVPNCVTLSGLAWPAFQIGASESPCPESEGSLLAIIPPSGVMDGRLPRFLDVGMADVKLLDVGMADAKLLDVGMADAKLLDMDLPEWHRPN